MPRSNFLIITLVMLIILLISMFVPYQRFNIDIKYATIIKLIIGAVVLGMGIRLLLYSR